MTKTTLTSETVYEIITTIPDDLDEDHLAALLLTIVDTQQRNGTHGQTVALLFQLFMTYCRSIGLSHEMFGLILSEASRTYAKQETKH